MIRCTQSQSVTLPSLCPWPNRLEPSLIESSRTHSIALHPPSIQASFLRRANPLLLGHEHSAPVRIRKGGPARQEEDSDVGGTRRQ
jgi:hypothetical protein